MNRKSRLRKITILKASLCAVLLRKQKDQLTDTEVDLLDRLSQDHEVQSLLEEDRVKSLERALGQ